MPWASMKRLKASHHNVGNVEEPINISPRAKERRSTPSSEPIPTSPRGISEPGSSGSDSSDEDLRSALAQTVPRLPSLTRMSYEDPSAHESRPNASTTTTAETAAPDITSLDGAAGSEHAQPQPGRSVLDDDIEDIDTLIASLEAAADENDKPVPLNPDQATDNPSPVREDWLHTDINAGLTTGEAEARIRACGFNEMKEEKKHIFRKWLSYCHGPIQYTMIVR